MNLPPTLADATGHRDDDREPATGWLVRLLVERSIKGGPERSSTPSPAAALGRLNSATVIPTRPTPEAKGADGMKRLVEFQAGTAGGVLGERLPNLPGPPVQGLPG